MLVKLYTDSLLVQHFAATMSVDIVLLRFVFAVSSKTAAVIQESQSEVVFHQELAVFGTTYATQNHVSSATHMMLASILVEKRAVRAMASSSNYQIFPMAGKAAIPVAKVHSLAVNYQLVASF